MFSCAAPVLRDMNGIQHFCEQKLMLDVLVRVGQNLPHLPLLHTTDTGPMWMSPVPGRCPAVTHCLMTPSLGDSSVGLSKDRCGPPSPRGTDVDESCRSPCSRVGAPANLCDEICVARLRCLGCSVCLKLEPTNKRDRREPKQS